MDRSRDVLLHAVVVRSAIGRCKSASPEGPPPTLPTGERPHCDGESWLSDIWSQITQIKRKLSLAKMFDLSSHDYIVVMPSCEARKARNGGA